jgi:sugar-specific transcriptional regulator TrmB
MNEQLKELGFTSGEERVYLALLKLGVSTTGIISKEANVSRSKLYEVLEKLARKGIVSHFKKNNVLHYQAANPNKILDFINEKEKLLNKQKEEFKEKIPYFQSLIKN